MNRKAVKNSKNNYEILVTGATGFVGRNLIKELVKKTGPGRILCLIYSKENSLEISGRKVIESLKVESKKVDLVTGEGLKDLPGNLKLVIHLAAETDTSKKDHRVNDLGTMNLYKALGKLNSKTHFIHIGTMVSVVGRPDCSKPINEDSLDYPTNEYTRTKIRGEEFMIKSSLKDKFRLTVIRPNTIYGKGVRRNSLFDMVRNMIDQNSIITKINWPGRSALIHVDDVVNTILKLSKLPPRPGKPEKYLLWSENLSISDISRIIHEKKRKKLNEIKIPDIFWQTIKSIRQVIPMFENFFPYPLYNYLWRFGIIIDDVVWCESRKIYKKLPSFKPKKFEQSVSDIVD